MREKPTLHTKYCCSTMRGRIKGTDSSINSILRTYKEPEAVWKRIHMLCLAFYDGFSRYKPVKTPSLVQYGNCRTRSVVSTSIKHSAAPRALSRLDHAPRSTIPVLHSRRCFNEYNLSQTNLRLQDGISFSWQQTDLISTGMHESHSNEA